jgi:hypothetical protein
VPHHRDEADDRDADERAWQAIVENYGERADLDEPEPLPPADPTPDPVADPPAEPIGPTGPIDAPFGGRFGDPRALQGDLGPDDEPDPEEGYQPPPPPPLPTIAPDRGLAWAGVLGSPIVLLVALIAQISIPGWLACLLIVGFVGGFLYLVAKMPREPRDPWDDGAQV